MQSGDDTSRVIRQRSSSRHQFVQATFDFSTGVTSFERHQSTYHSPLLRNLLVSMQRFQPSETKKREVVQVLVDLVLKGGSGAFYLKMCDVLAQQEGFSIKLRSILVVCKVRNVCNLS